MTKLKFFDIYEPIDTSPPTITISKGEMRKVIAAVRKGRRLLAKKLKDRVEAVPVGIRKNASRLSRLCDRRWIAEYQDQLTVEVVKETKVVSYKSVEVIQKAFTDG